MLKLGISILTFNKFSFKIRSGVIRRKRFSKRHNGKRSEPITVISSNMNIDYDVPFYSNTSDDTHCFQAALKMVLKYFQPDKEFSWEDLERISAKKKDLWTWPLVGMVWMKNYGFDVVDVEVFDYQRFIKEKENYVLSFYGDEAGNEQIIHSDISQEIIYAEQLLDAKIVQKAIPTIETLRDFLLKRYLLICLINSQKLNGKEGYIGHFVVVKGIKDEALILHDPGLPPLKNREVKFKAFESAWTVPDENAKNVMAFRLAKSI